MSRQFEEQKREFLAQHELTEDALVPLLDAAKMDRKKTLGIGALIVVVMLGFAFRAYSAVPNVVDSIAQERMQKVDEVLTQKLGEAKALSARLFLFLGKLFEESVPAKSIKQHWDAAKGDLGSLSNDVKSMGNSPIDSGGRLLSTGTDRISRVITHAAIVARSVQELLPLTLDAFRSAAANLEKESNGIETMLGSLDALFAPFIGVKTPIAAEWVTLRADFSTWYSSLQSEAQKIRLSIEGGTLTADFTVRLVGEIF